MDRIMVERFDFSEVAFRLFHCCYKYLTSYEVMEGLRKKSNVCSKSL